MTTGGPGRGWQTLWKGWSILMTLVEGYELAQTIASAK